MNGKKTFKSFAFENSYQDKYLYFLGKFGCQNMKLFVEKMHLPGYIYVHYSINTGRGCVILITSVVCSFVHGQEDSLKFG